VAVHVLIVDDHPTFRRAARRVLARLPGFELVGEADTGEESIEAARLLRPDLVLMDVHLPDISGLEASRRILSQAKDRPVVFLLSTYEAAEYGSQAAGCGALAYLPKAEFGPATLASAWTVAAAARPS
jgi:DNA-binding NarL/FixJ family response regulator